MNLWMVRKISKLQMVKKKMEMMVVVVVVVVMVVLPVLVGGDCISVVWVEIFLFVVSSMYDDVQVITYLAVVDSMCVMMMMMMMPVVVSLAIVGTLLHNVGRSMLLRYSWWHRASLVSVVDNLLGARSIGLGIHGTHTCQFKVGETTTNFGKNPPSTSRVSHTTTTAAAASLHHLLLTKQCLHLIRCSSSTVSSHATHTTCTATTTASAHSSHASHTTSTTCASTIISATTSTTFLLL
mmetsp:Transcript_13712/g.21402  ORF Transcript_13712/g.21402 Transcript_13712/m.21402 type:complete len:238 (-) Transcript_13712:1360-2073(-)